MKVRRKLRGKSRKKLMQSARLVEAHFVSVAPSRTAGVDISGTLMDLLEGLKAERVADASL